jgi:hypothetical protein
MDNNCSNCINYSVLGIGANEINRNVSSFEAKKLVEENPARAIEKVSKILQIKSSTGLNKFPTEDEVLTVMN